MSAVPERFHNVRVVIIDGSPRLESASRELCYCIARCIEQQGAQVSVFDQREHRLPLFDDNQESAQHEAVQALFELVSSADAIVLSSPEYHNSISGALKNALDWLSLLPKDRIQPMMLCGLIGGGGAMGNAGALLQMMMAVRSMKWWLMPDAMVSVPNIWDMVSDGCIHDPGIQERVEFFAESIVRYSREFALLRHKQRARKGNDASMALA